MMTEILERAAAAGFMVLLNGRIGQQDYHSVCGSETSLRRFEEACLAPANADGNLIERLREHAALQPDSVEAFLMREAARALARQHYVNMANEAKLAALTSPN